MQTLNISQLINNSDRMSIIFDSSSGRKILKFIIFYVCECEISYVPVECLIDEWEMIFVDLVPTQKIFGDDASKNSNLFEKIEILVEKSDLIVLELTEILNQRKCTSFKTLIRSIQINERAIISLSKDSFEVPCYEVLLN